VTATAVGSATLSFSDPDNGTFTYMYRGVTQSKAITRQIFSSPVPRCNATGERFPWPANFKDLWWRGPERPESGWGVNIAHQGDILFATWFAYDASGKGQWLVMPHGAPIDLAPEFRLYEGIVFRTTGPAFDAVPLDPAKVTRTAVGAAGFHFGEPHSGLFRYQLDALVDSKAIVRQVFSAPATVCR